MSEGEVLKGILGWSDMINVDIRWEIYVTHVNHTTKPQDTVWVLYSPTTIIAAIPSYHQQSSFTTQWVSQQLTHFTWFLLYTQRTAALM